MPKWETHRGDEWWYQDDALEASASVNLVLQPPAFMMSVVPRASHTLSAAKLLFLLRRTEEELPEFELWCAIDEVTSPILTELKKTGELSWEVIEHPQSRDARIIKIS